MINSARKHKRIEWIDDDEFAHEDPVMQYSAPLVSDTDVNDLALRKAPRQPRHRAEV